MNTEITGIQTTLNLAEYCNQSFFVIIFRCIPPSCKTRKHDYLITERRYKEQPI